MASQGSPYQYPQQTDGDDDSCKVGPLEAKILHCRQSSCLHLQSLPLGTHLLKGRRTSELSFQNPNGSTFFFFFLTFTSNIFYHK